MTELPRTYKACVYDEPGKISTKVVDLDMPEPGSGEVLINLSVSPNVDRSAMTMEPIANESTAVHIPEYVIPT